MTDVLEIRAGEYALQQIRDNGLKADDINVMLGASGGPKWFVLSGLDKVLISEFFKGREKPLHLLGTSAGSWRFSTYAMKDPLEAHRRFEQGYLLTSYSEQPDAAEISMKSRILVREMLGDTGVRDIIENPVFKFNSIAVRSHGLGTSEKKWPLMAGMGLAATANLFSRKTLSNFFTRTLFHHPDSSAPFLDMNDLPTETVPFSEQNVSDAILSSGSIPMVMEGIRDIAGAPKGMYRDGGVTDYHFDLNFDLGDGLVLYPHFYNRMIPGWFDKALKWRKPAVDKCKNLILVSPSEEFVSKLPFGKIPDRNDFVKLSYDDRVEYWQTVIAESDRLGSVFMEWVDSGRISKKVKPLF
ncbi:hypothetical protein EOPP23_09425 [Endozoicomonas sp. OPT23]|uniref:patatin-like phospholipase family protein n=1 Tax=Endozoicomonas sp. OPT23 TaxID=2072845 RepID=UPI00129AAF04|nr:patatin-like phospholipase family protein [Endozoicomonas sp. OPT23]MRI33203.1 hypothetical protein [Endozoicomonas sp. OPT23]